MRKCTTSSEPRIISSSTLNKKQSTLSRFFTAKSDACRPPKRTLDDIAVETTSECKQRKIAKDLNEVTINKLKRFNNEHTDHKERVVLDLNNEKTTKISSPIVKENANKNLTSLIHENSVQNSLEKRLTKNGNLTPLEKQFVDIKAKHPDALLFVECGYKYRFFGDDAQIAARILNIMCYEDHNFMTASIPVHRLNVHVRRLVDAGYKVGIVQQTETAAIKAMGDNKNTPFMRKLTSLYTRSTLVGEKFEDDKLGEGTGNSNMKFLMCITESCIIASEKNKILHDPVLLAIVAVQPVSGNVIYDTFEDTRLRQELETRLEHINPVDLLIPGNLSENSKKCIQNWSNQCGLMSKVRIEEVPSGKIPMLQEALTTLAGFYDSKDSWDFGSSRNKEKPAVSMEFENNNCGIPAELAKLPESLMICLSVILEYLKAFGLENVLRITSNFTTFFKTESYMKLPSSTIRNLEIFNNQTDNSVKGSLFWVLDRTLTAFGKRKLHVWISRPLQNLREIKERQEAIAEIIVVKPVCVEKLKRLLSHLPDLEKGLCVICQRKCSSAQFYNILTSLSKVYTEIISMKDLSSKELKSSLLNGILGKVSTDLSDIDNYLDAIDEKAAKNCDKTRLFKNDSEFPHIGEWREKIQEKQREIQSHRKEIEKVLRKPSVDYVTVSGNEFLVEVTMSKMKLVPHDWIKISSTKTVTRFRTPFIDRCFQTLCQYREHHSNACKEAWLKFLASFASNCDKYSIVVRQLGTLDCLISLAEVAEQQGYTRPHLSDKTGNIQIKDGRHPVVDVLLNDQGQYVPNDTCLESNSKRCMIITGPNMGGKSSYVKQVALICIMAQIGSFVPAEKAELGIIDAVYTRMGANDNIFNGRSTFMNELQETSYILKNATPSSLVILDELGRGTSTHDGTAIAYATLSYVITNVTSLTLFITHYPSLADLQLSFPTRVSNYHMSFIAEGPDLRKDNNTKEHESLPGVKTVTFLYRLVNGVAKNSYGLNVAKLAAIPSQILQNAAVKSDELQSIIRRRRNKTESFNTIWNCSSEELKQNIQELIDLHYKD